MTSLRAVGREKYQRLFTSLRVSSSAMCVIDAPASTILRFYVLHVPLLDPPSCLLSTKEWDVMIFLYDVSTTLRDDCNHVILLYACWRQWITAEIRPKSTSGSWSPRRTSVCKRARLSPTFYGCGSTMQPIPGESLYTPYFNWLIDDDEEIFLPNNWQKRMIYLKEKERRKILHAGCKASQFVKKLNTAISTGRLPINSAESFYWVYHRAMTTPLRRHSTSLQGPVHAHT